MRANTDHGQVITEPAAPGAVGVASGHPKYRADIDGLRAIAVLSVVGFHAFPGWIRGGYVGVDVFFVISGYLISSIILGSLARGTFSFGDFYSRRVRRIFPALILVLSSCLAFGWFGLLADEYRQLGKHVAAGAGFISNLVLWSEAGYFDASAESKVLLHLWSLGIEEQFYFVWPLLLWLVSARRTGLAVILWLTAALSFVGNLVVIGADQVQAFYSPLLRFWELVCGAMLAHASIRSRPTGLLSGLPAHVAGFAGAGSIAAALLLLSSTSRFPGWWALLPVGGACLIVAAGPGAWFNRVILSCRPIVWVGLISYSLYLWHWPLLALARTLEGEVPAPAVRIAAVILAILLAGFTYFAVERPFRTGGALRAKAVGLTLVMFVVGCAGYGIMAGQGYPNRFARTGSTTTGIEVAKRDQFNEQCIREFGRMFLPMFDRKWDFCHRTGDEAGAIVIGDSHASSLYTGLREVDPATSYLNLGRSSCLPFHGIDGALGNRTLGCQPTVANLLDHALQSKARVVYITGFYARDFDGRISTDVPEVLASHMDESLRRLSESGKRVVVVLDAPGLPFAPEACLWRPFRLTRDRDCSFPREHHDRDSAAYQRALVPLVRKHHGVSYYDPAEDLCSAGVCRAVRDGKVLYWDSHHLNAEGARIVARGLLAQVPR